MLQLTAQVGTASTNKYSAPFGSMLRHRSSNSRDVPSPSSSSRRITGSKTLWRSSREPRRQLNYDARPYKPAQGTVSDTRINSPRIKLKIRFAFCFQKLRVIHLPHHLQAIQTISYRCNYNSLANDCTRKYSLCIQPMHRKSPACCWKCHNLN